MNFSARIIFLLNVLCVSLVLHANNPSDSLTTELVICIKPVFGKEDLRLETKKYCSAFGDTIQIDRLRFYLSSFELLYSNGTSFVEENSYHLIDAEDEESLTIILHHIPAGTLRLITFSIGVDSIKSVSGAMDGDLDPRHGMYWAWNSGYINAKLEGRSSSCLTRQKRFEFHIGGYAFPENSLRKITPGLTAFDVRPSKKNRVTLESDVSKWFTGISLAKLPEVAIPGKAALQIADNYSTMFRIIAPDEN